MCKKQRNEQKLGDGKEQRRKKEEKSEETYKSSSEAGGQEEIASKSLGEGC